MRFASFSPSYAYNGVGKFSQSSAVTAYQLGAHLLMMPVMQVTRMRTGMPLTIMVTGPARIAAEGFPPVCGKTIKNGSGLWYRESAWAPPCKKCKEWSKANLGIDDPKNLQYGNLYTPQQGMGQLNGPDNEAITAWQESIRQENDRYYPREYTYQDL